MSLGLSACASYTGVNEYTSASCDTLRTLQVAYDNDTKITATRQLDGVNALDRRQRDLSTNSQRPKDYRAVSINTAAEVDAINSAYRKNDCNHKIDRQ